MMGAIPQTTIVPPSSLSSTVQAPPKPLFPAAVPQVRTCLFDNLCAYLHIFFLYC